MGRDWLGEVRHAGVLAVAESLGLRARGRSLAPCPVCGAPRRGQSDGRGPIGVRLDDRGWCCHLCGARGDAPALLMLWLWGRAAGSAQDWRKLFSFCVARGFCEGNQAGEGRGVRAPESSARRAGDGGVVRSCEMRSPTTRAPRPPGKEVEELWASCRPVVEEADVRAWLRARGIDAERVATLELARAVVQGAELPMWARYRGRPWTERGHRLLVPMWNEEGKMESLHARSVIVVEEKGSDKAASPAGFAIAGLVMANALGRLLLERSICSSARMEIVEGVPDFLASAASVDGAHPILGVIAGSWGSAVAARVPSGVKVCLRTHDDVAGELYAQAVALSLGTRCSVVRESKGQASLVESGAFWR